MSYSVLSPRVANLLSIKFCFLLSLFWMGSTNPSLALERFWPLSTSLRLATLSGKPPFFTTYFDWPPFLLCSFDSNLSFLIGAFAWFFKITKVAHVKSIEVFSKHLFLALHSSLFSSTILLFSAFFHRMFSLC